MMRQGVTRGGHVDPNLPLPLPQLMHMDSSTSYVIGPGGGGPLVPRMRTTKGCGPVADKDDVDLPCPFCVGNVAQLPSPCAQVAGTSLLPWIWGRLADESFMNLPLSPLFVPIGQLYVLSISILAASTAQQPPPPQCDRLVALRRVVLRTVDSLGPVT